MLLVEEHVIDSGKAGGGEALLPDEPHEGQVVADDPDEGVQAGVAAVCLFQEEREDEQLQEREGEGDGKREDAGAGACPACQDDAVGGAEEGAGGFRTGEERGIRLPEAELL